MSFPFILNTLNYLTKNESCTEMIYKNLSIYLHLQLT